MDIQLKRWQAFMQQDPVCHALALSRSKGLVDARGSKQLS